MKSHLCLPRQEAKYIFSLNSQILASECRCQTTRVLQTETWRKRGSSRLCGKENVISKSTVVSREHERKRSIRFSLMISLLFMLTTTAFVDFLRTFLLCPLVISPGVLSRTKHTTAPNTASLRHRSLTCGQHCSRTGTTAKTFSYL